MYYDSLSCVIVRSLNARFRLFGGITKVALATAICGPISVPRV